MIFKFLNIFVLFFVLAAAASAGITAFEIALLIVTLFYAKKYKIPVRDAFQWSPKVQAEFSQWFGLGAPALLCCLGLFHFFMLFLTYAVPAIPQKLFDDGEYQKMIAEPWGFINVVVIAPVIIELAFRWVYFKTLERTFTLSAAFWVSSVLYAFLNLDLAGELSFAVVMCSLVVRYQSILPGLILSVLLKLVSHLEFLWVMNVSPYPTELLREDLLKWGTVFTLIGAPFLILFLRKFYPLSSKA